MLPGPSFPTRPRHGIRSLGRFLAELDGTVRREGADWFSATLSSLLEEEMEVSYGSTTIPSVPQRLQGVR